ncbi:MAG: hypothetical protein RL685_4133 [Pseudomonadota bacterium]|jgi:hypothetical protein
MTQSNFLRSSTLWFSTAASLSLFGCSAGDVVDPISEERASTVAQDLSVAPAQGNYVQLRRDVRRCAAPLCGGFFVDAVNRDTLRCVDGRRSAECYVSDLDLSSLGLSEAQQAVVRGEPTTFLLRGEIQPRRSRAGTLGELVVSEAWQGHADAAPSGDFFRARNEGIVCITTPCLSFSAELLNRNAASTPLAGIDVSAISDDPTEAFAQLDTPEGLLLAGRRSTVRGPAGRARGLTASEFYVPFVAEQQSCGSRGQAQCEEGSFCNFPVSAACGSFDAPGVCEPLPEACIEIFAPVCGCDGETYGNSCFAAAAGVSVSAEGACEPEPPIGQACGSRGLPQCGDGFFCAFPPEANCGRSDAPGVCAQRAEACILIFDPVCGCDGRTYSNSCIASSAGVSVERDGACDGNAE